MAQLKNRLDKDTVTKIVKGALIAGGGAAIIYALEVFVTLDFGQSTALVVALAAVLINAVKEFRKGERA